MAGEGKEPPFSKGKKVVDCGGGKRNRRHGNMGSRALKKHKFSCLGWLPKKKKKEKVKHGGRREKNKRG